MHVVEDPFAVLLLFLLDMIERLPHLGIGHLEDGGVVSCRDIFFGGEHILAERGVVLRLCCERCLSPPDPVELLPWPCCCLLRPIPSRLCPEQDLVDRVQVLLLLAGMVRKAALIGVFCLLA